VQPEFVVPEEFAHLVEFEVVGGTIATTQLPNWDEAWAPRTTLTNYALSTAHDEGQHKATMFQLELGFEAADWRLLRDQLLEGFPEVKATFYTNKGFGPCWTVSIVVVGPKEAVRWITTGWIVEYRDPRPKLTTLYPERSKRNKELRRLDGRLNPARMARGAVALRHAAPAA
jgi:Domain of unknown function (DUF6883)